MCNSNKKDLIGILKILQEPLPLIHNPFSYYAKKLNLSEEEVILLIKNYLKEGIIRRVAGILKHNKAGFLINSMVVMKIEEKEIDKIGTELSKFRFITHCYKRTSYADWQYNLYAMVHAKTEEELEKYIDQIKSVVGKRDMIVLRSIKEYKKMGFRV
ncbi:MAG: hypothetical protein N2053_01315 [Chitinispirillaceae bacterium]|nr:hypothetical protein [Chitinispirillaceae bacterium]